MLEALRVVCEKKGIVVNQTGIGEVGIDADRVPKLGEPLVVDPQFEDTMEPEFSVESSEVYMICPRHLRSLGIELLKRTRENAYRSHKEHKHLGDEERAALYDDFKATIDREGFRNDCPITVKMRRKDGKDKILQGHHRLAIAIELGLSTVPVRFVF